jgi:hypothetical protein
METPANDLKALQNFHKTLVTAMVLFLLSGILFVNFGWNIPRRTSLNTAFLPTAIILAILLVGFSYPLFKKKLGEAKMQNELASRFQGYRTACILQMAMTVGPFLFSVISYILTGNIVFLLIVAILLLNFLNIYPSKRKLVQQLELSNQEADWFE